MTEPTNFNGLMITRKKGESPVQAFDRTRREIVAEQGKATLLGLKVEARKGGQYQIRMVGGARGYPRRDGACGVRVKGRMDDV